MKTIGFLLFILSLFSSNFCQAQKKQKRQAQYIAHYNSEDLKANWREWQEMELEVKEYEDSLNTVFEIAKEKFHADLQAFQDKPSGTQGGIERAYKKFQQQEKQLLQQEIAIDSQVLVRKEPLEGNLQQKLNNALQLIVENGNYTYILDAATITMHINGGEDVTILLLEELGN